MRTYTLTQPAYGQPVGTSLALDPSDPLVQLNVESGVLLPGEDAAFEAERMTCPICQEHMKRAPKLESPEELAGHYSTKHAGFVAPDWNPDNGEED